MTLDILIRQYREAKDQIAAVEEELKPYIEQLRFQIQQTIEETGESYKDSIGYARINAPGERISYSASDLDGLLADISLYLSEDVVDKSPVEMLVWIQEQLKKFRRVTKLSGGLVIK